MTIKIIDKDHKVVVILSEQPPAPGVYDTREFPLRLSGARRYDPDGGASAESGAQMSMLVDESTGDWSWKPNRDKALGENFKTFRGVPQRGHR